MVVVALGSIANGGELEPVERLVEDARSRGGKVLAGGRRTPGQRGYFYEPTVIAGVDHSFEVMREETFGPLIPVFPFDTEEEVLTLANDSEFGLGAGLWTRDINRAYRMGRAIKAGRVWTNCYHLYPAHGAFGGYKKSGVGRENHKMMLDHYQQTQNLLVSYDINPLGFF